ncbi:MAG: NHL repeat-containing protein, partial [Dolichospermum sp.]
MVQNYFFKPLLAVLLLCSTIAVKAQIYEVSTFAGSGTAGATNGTGTAASFNNPQGVVVDVSGNIYVTDYNNHLIRKITNAGVVTTFAGTGTSGAVNGTGTAASFRNPINIALDGSGNLYVADYGNNLIRKISTAGVVTTLAGSGSIGAANGTGTAASFYWPNGVAVDGAGNVYVADQGNHLIRKITAAGVVTTFAGSGTAGATNGTGTAASFNSPTGVAIDAAGNLYVSDYNNSSIRKITSAGVVTTLAGSGTTGATNATGTAASFNKPYGVAVDGSGNVFVADRFNHLIRKITATGVVTTIAGSGTNATVNGIGTSASFSYPSRLTVDGLGNIFVSSGSENTIRKLTLYCGTPTISGNSAFCAGGSTTLTSSSASGYLWSTGETTQSITVNTVGSYSVRAIDAAAACTSAASTAVAVTSTALPTTRTITPATPAATCATAVTLTSSTSAGNTYQWKLNGIDIPGATAVTYSAATSGNYTVVAVTPQGCTSAAVSNTVAVTVNSLPTTPNITGATTFCAGSNTTLSTDYTLGTNEAYLWSNNSSLSTLTVSTAG